MTTSPLTLAAVDEALPPSAILCLGHRLAAAACAQPSVVFAPDRITFGDGGLVHMTPGPVSPRWRAPEARAASLSTATSELWGLGRLLLELSLGHAVDDAIADHADAGALRALRDRDGRPLPDRVVEILAVLLNPRADERLQSARAAERVFKDAAARFDDGAAVLAAALARAAARVADDEGDADRDRGGVGDPHEEPAATVQLSTRDIFDTGTMKQAAAVAEAERRRQQAVAVRRTEDLPSRAILSPEELARVADAAESAAKRDRPKKDLPTLVVRKRATGSAPVDGEILPAPKLLGPASSPPQAPEQTLPAAEPEAPKESAESEEPEEAFASAERRRRRLLVAGLVAFGVVVAAVVAVATSTAPADPAVDALAPLDAPIDRAR